MVKTVRETLDALEAGLRSDAPFYYTRYGDGDFEIMLGRSEMQHSADPELARELTELFRMREPGHLLAVALHQNEPGMVDGLFKAWTNPQYHEFVAANTPADAGPFYNAIAMHYAAVYDPLRLRALLDLMRPRLKYFVGNAPIDKVQRLVGPITGYTRSTYTNAYREVDMLYNQLMLQIGGAEEQPLILMAAGMTSRVLTKRLMEDKIDAQVIDLGSLVDYAIGNPNRTWIKMAGPNNLAILLEDK